MQAAADCTGFAEVEREICTGTRIRFARNNYDAKRLERRTAEVLAIGAEEGLVVAGMKGGKRQTLDY